MIAVWVAAVLIFLVACWIGVYLHVRYAAACAAMPSEPPWTSEQLRNRRRARMRLMTYYRWLVNVPLIVFVYVLLWNPVLRPLYEQLTASP